MSATTATFGVATMGYTALDGRWQRDAVVTWNAPDDTEQARIERILGVTLPLRAYCVGCSHWWESSNLDWLDRMSEQHQCKGACV